MKRIHGQIISVEPDLDWAYFTTADGEVNGFRLSLLGAEGAKYLGQWVIATEEVDEIVRISIGEAASAAAAGR